VIADRLPDVEDLLDAGLEVVRRARLGQDLPERDDT